MNEKRLSTRHGVAARWDGRAQVRSGPGWLLLMLFLAPGLVAFQGMAATRPQTNLKLQVGEVRVLSIKDVARVAVGNGHVVNAVTTDEKEVILFARHAGSSSLHVWSADGIVVSPDQPDLARRIDKSRAIIEQTFPDENLINVPIDPLRSLPPPAEDGGGAGRWNPYQGGGTQWVLRSASSPPGFPSPAAAGNQRAFTE